MNHFYLQAKMWIIFAVFALAQFPTFLQAESFYIERYDIDVTISEQGYFDVVERILVQFTEKRRGIIRFLPIRETIEGKNIKIDISNISVDGWDSKITNENGYKKIRIGDPNVFVDGAQEYKIRYRVQNAFLFHDDMTEFHWNLIGTEWDAPIREVSYAIEVPDPVEIIDYAAFSGQKNTSTEMITIEQRGSRFEGSSRESLEAGEGLTVAIAMAVNAIDRSGSAQDLAEQGKGFSDYFFPIPALFAAFMLGIWRRKGRNSKLEPLSEEIYYPPDDVAAAELGVMIDDRANDRDVLALIPEWGRQGYLRIRGTGESKGDIKSDMFIEKKDELPPDTPKYQKLLFDSLFKETTVVLLSSLKEKFYQDFEKARSALKREVRHSNFYDPESYQIFHKGLFILIGILCMIIGILVLIFTGKIVTGIMLILMIIPAFIIHFSRPKKSNEGIEFLTKLKSFKQFLKNTPTDKVNSILESDPGYFERMLPYAVAFGLDKDWINKFETFNQNVPSWYYYGIDPHHSHRANMTQFQNDFSIDTVRSVFKSAPASDPGSGSFSGGSTGGGFGGGGGSSW